MNRFLCRNLFMATAKFTFLNENKSADNPESRERLEFEFYGESAWNNQTVYSNLCLWKGFEMKMTQIDFVLCLLLSTILFWSGY